MQLLLGRRAYQRSKYYTTSTWKSLYKKEQKPREYHIYWAKNCSLRFWSFSASPSFSHVGPTNFNYFTLRRVRTMFSPYQMDITIVIRVLMIRVLLRGEKWSLESAPRKGGTEYRSPGSYYNKNSSFCLSRICPLYLWEEIFEDDLQYEKFTGDGCPHYPQPSMYFWSPCALWYITDWDRKSFNDRKIVMTAWVLSEPNVTCLELQCSDPGGDSEYLNKVPIDLTHWFSM